jgi:hypothetical protein
MTLQPGCSFVIAPHFHFPADWSRRLLVGAGVENANGCFLPLPPWRPTTDDELSLLVRDSAAPPSPEELEHCVCLFQLPGHLQGKWWSLLEEAVGTLGDCQFPGFEQFVGQLGEFLSFKRLPLPEDARCDMVVSDSRQKGVLVGPETNQTRGLNNSLAPSSPWPFAEELRRPGLWGGINMGDEPTSVVLINLPCRELDAQLRRRFPDEPLPASVGDLSERFLRCCSDYPPVRLILGPGEGYRLPHGGLILEGNPEIKQEPDMLLMISHQQRFPT